MIKLYITKIIHFTILIQFDTQQEKKISCKPFFEKRRIKNGIQWASWGKEYNLIERIPIPIL